jgi:hypothetical protein
MRYFVCGGVLLALLAGCGTTEPKAPDVASLATPGAGSPSSAASPASTPEGERPRHRVDETQEESTRLIEPWLACMKKNGADMDEQPNSSIKAAEEWSAAHQDARNACIGKLPLLPWGEDRENPAYRDNIHNWVKCMTDQGMDVVETPDADQSPWHFGNRDQPADSAKIERDCEVKVMGPSDK